MLYLDDLDANCVEMNCFVILVCFVFFPQELENLRKQAEIIPQLMAECESITTKLQVRFFYFKAPRNLTNQTFLSGV